MRKRTGSLLPVIGFILLSSACSIQKQIGKEADRDILLAGDFLPAHVGISLYDPSAQQYLYNHQGEKLFVPASNMKLFSCYAAMKYLGDSLIGLRYIDKGDGTIEAEGAGDPSFLHPGFRNQPVYQWLRNKNRILLTDANWRDNGLGAGWAWDDYNSDYMAERSVLPIYGNTVRFTAGNGLTVVPSYFQRSLGQDTLVAKGSFIIRREFGGNTFTVRPSVNRFVSTEIPFAMGDGALQVSLLADTLHTRVEQSHGKLDRATALKIYSQPLDSMLKPMMHRSDNFFAEQSLLMVSNEKLGFMNDAKIIDTLLKTDLNGLPQKPKWVDGSGLSRYNLVSPQDFVWVLNQMRNEFKWERIIGILPTGGEGTLASYYKNYSGRLYAKTGSLSNHIALSGYLTTKKGKLLIFSVLVNAYQAPAANIRKGVEKFLTAIIERY